MRVFHSLEAYEPGKYTVATIGTFDGIHNGHKQLLQRMKDVAAAQQGETLLISFHPHPRLVLNPLAPLSLLQTMEEKIAELEAFGIDKLLLIPFSLDFAKLSSQDFIEEILVHQLHIQHLVIGYDHHFGKNRSGDIHELQHFARIHGYTVEEVTAFAQNNLNVSSTKIRHALTQGEIQTANTFLGYRYALTGTVIHGEKQGRLLGYPTANIQVNDAHKLIPANGIYFVMVLHHAQKYYGMMSIGHKPTMGEFERGIEVYIFDFEKDIYHDTITVAFLAYIRPEAKFDSWDALIDAIKGDETYCRTHMKDFPL